jgi:hypothetical protein
MNRDFFFSGCANPANVSDFIVALAAGQPLQADRLPAELLPCAVLLATIGLRAFQQQIVDDYIVLLDRMEDCFKAVDHASVGGFYHPQLHLVSRIVEDGPQAPFLLDQVPEAEYIFGVYKELVEADVEALFHG